MVFCFGWKWCGIVCSTLFVFDAMFDDWIHQSEQICKFGLVFFNPCNGASCVWPCYRLPSFAGKVFPSGCSPALEIIILPKVSERIIINPIKQQSRMVQRGTLPRLWQPSVDRYLRCMNRLLALRCNKLVNYYMCCHSSLFSLQIVCVSVLKVPSEHLSLLHEQFLFPIVALRAF